MNGGGFCISVGIAASGLPIILCSMQNLLGRDVITDFSFFAMGLYFFFVTTPFQVMIIGCALNVVCTMLELVVSAGINTIELIELKSAGIGMLVH